MPSDLAIAPAAFIAKHPELHHYTSYKGLEGIITSQCLWATHYRALNDSEEVNILRGPLTQCLAKRLAPDFEALQRVDPERYQKIQKLGGPSEASRIEAKNFIDILYETTFAARQDNAYAPPFITSFCTHFSDAEYERNNGLLSQWRAYGGGGRCGEGRYCLVFDTRKLLRMLKQERDAYIWPWIGINEVTYARDEFITEKNFTNLLDSIETFQRDCINDRKLNARRAYKLFVDMATLLKHRGFSEEREVRVVACPLTPSIARRTYKLHKNNPPLKNVKCRHDSDRNIPYIALFEDLKERLPIKRVIVGPSHKQGENCDRARALVGDSALVTCSETPFIG